MPSLCRLTARPTRSTLHTRSLRSNRSIFIFTSQPIPTPPRLNSAILPPLKNSAHKPTLTSTHLSSRTYATSTPPEDLGLNVKIDELIEDIQEQYFTARDEFEIATEETEKKSVYAAEDRAAAREELDKLKEMYEDALGGSDGAEIKRRIGHRIRELDNAVVALEEKALED